jgi:hypothetical protein
MKPATGGGAPEPSKVRRLAKTVLLAAAITLGLFYWWWGSDAESRAIRHLPSRERQALLSRTLENLRSVCQSPEDALREFCNTQAQMALEIPECDGACRERVRERLSQAGVPR